MGLLADADCLESAYNGTNHAELRQLRRLEMEVCKQCGSSKEPDVSPCPTCGMRTLPESVDTEISHIDYLLAEIRKWQAYGWIHGAFAMRLNRHYEMNRAALLNPTAKPWSPGQRVQRHVCSESHLDSAKPASQRPSAETGPPWIAEFLEAHWLKLLAALAAIFIFVGMRQVLGWEWVSTLAIGLIPALPIGLTALLYSFGIKARKGRSVGEFAYLAVACVLTGFSVFAVNQYWLARALPEPTCLTLAAAAVTAMAGLTFHLTRENGFLHLVLAGCLATLNAVVRVLNPAPVEGGQSASIYSAANLALGAALLFSARYLTAKVEEPRRILVTWAHLACSAGLLWASLPAVLHGTSPENAAILLFAASGVYLLSAQAFASAGMGYLSGALGAGAAAVLLRDLSQLNWYPIGFASLTLSGLTIALEYLNRDEDRRPLAKAYGDLSLCYAVAAAAAVVVRFILSLNGEAPSVTSTDWPQAAALTALTAVIFGLHIWARNMPALAIPSAGAGVAAMTLVTDRFLANSGIVPAHTLANSLLPSAVLMGVVTVWILRRASLDGETPAARCGLLMLPLLAAEISGALLNTLGVGFERGADVALWASLSGYGVLSAALAEILPGERTSPWRRSAAAATVSALVAAGGFSGLELAPRWGVTACAMTLGATGWLLAALWKAVPASKVDPWRMAISAGALAAGILGGSFAGLGEGGTLTSVIIGVGLNFTALLAFTACELCAISTPAAAGVGALGALRLATMLPEIGVAFALFGAVLLGCQAARLRKEALGWAAVGAFALAGGLGSFGAAYPQSTAGWLACLSLVFGGAWCLFGARQWQRSEFASAGSALWLAAYVRAAISVRPHDLAWLPLAVLPMLLALYAAGVVMRKEPVIGGALQDFAAGSSIVACASAMLIAVGGSSDAQTAAITLVSYGLLYLARAMTEPDRFWAGLSAVTLSSAAGFALAGRSLAPSEWSAWFGLVAAAVLAAGWAARPWSETSAIWNRIAAANALITAVVALVSANTPGQGVFSLAALIEAGAVFAALAVQRCGLVYAHAGFACWFAAYFLVLYDQVGLDARLLDLYFIPVGAYVLAMSHLASRRGEAESAGHLWLAGLLTILTPTFIAFRANYAAGEIPVHALLLLMECVAAIAWGITHRIRVFVLIGTGYSLAFAATLMSGSIVEAWTGLIAVAVGITILAFVFYVSLHQDGIRFWMSRLNQEWSRWR